jgi:uncharacterized repeat protein (TIGR01451 family)
VDIAVFGSDFTGSSVRGGVQLLRNTADPSDNFGTFVNAGVEFILELPIPDPNAFFPGDIAISDLTLDGIPEVVIANHYSDTIDIYRFAVIRNPDTGEFTMFLQEGRDQLRGIDGPMKFAIGDVNKDSKPDIAVGNFSTDQLAIYLNNKGNTRGTNPLALAVTLTPGADPESGIAIPGDVVTAELTYSNDGFVDLTSTVLTAVVPRGYEVAFTDTNSDNIDDNNGFTREIGRTGKTTLTWTIGDLPLVGDGRKRFNILVPDNARIRSRLTVNATLKNSGGKKAARANILIATTVSVTAKSEGTTVFPGGLAEFRFKVKNHAGYAALGVTVTAPVPAGCGLRTVGGAPGFIDSNGDLIERVNPTTGQTVVPPRVAPFFHLDEDGDPDLDNPAWPADRRSVSWYVGTMTPGEEVRLRMIVRLAYDFDATNPATLTLGAVSGRQKVTGPATGDIGEIIQLGAVPSFNIVPAVGAVDRPSLALSIGQHSAGVAPNKEFVTVTTSVAPVPGVDPLLKTNQIRYTLLYGNMGDALAESLRLHALIPPGTTLDRKNVVVNGQKLLPSRVQVIRFTGSSEFVEVPEIEDEVTDGNFLVLDVPFLEADFPFVAGSARTVTFTVTLKARTPLGTQLFTYAFLRSDELIETTFGTPITPTAHVVPPVNLSLVRASTSPVPVTMNGQVFSTAAIYQNTGGVAANAVEVTFDVPAGAKFSDAFFLDENLGRTLVGGTISKPASGATSGTIRYRVATVPPGGFVRVETAYTADFSTLSTNVNDPGAFNATPQIRITDSSERLTAALPERTRAAFDFPPISAALRNVEFPTPMAPQGDNPRLIVLQKAPRRATPGGNITYTLVWANPSGQPSGAGGLVFEIPENTTFVSATNTVTLVSGDNNKPPLGAPAVGGTGIVTWTETPDAHDAILATVTVRVSDNPTRSVVTSGSVKLAADQSGVFFAAPVKTVIARAEATDDELRNALVGAMTGATAELALADPVFQSDIDKWLASNGAVIGVAGGGVLRLDAGPMIIPIGGGNIVAAGGGNVVANDGAGIVAGGGGNIVAAGGGNIVAAGGGNVVANDGAGIVAAGGGNFMRIEGLTSHLSQSQLYNLAATAYFDAKGITLPNASIVAGGGGNIVAGGGLNLIGQDAASLINNDTSLPVLVSGNPVKLDPAIVGTLHPGKAAGFIATASGSLQAQFGAGVVSAGDSLQLTVTDGHLIGDGGGTYSQIVAGGGGNIVAAGGGNLIGDGGGTAPRETAPRRKR